jgi:hypothetical protein
MLAGQAFRLLLKLLGPYQARGGDCVYGWSRRTEYEMVRGLFIQRGPSERMTFEAVMKRYLADLTPTKRPLTQNAETPVPIRVANVLSPCTC